MTIVSRPSATGPSMLGGSMELAARECRHAEPRSVHPWIGEEGTAGTVAVVGAGKMGLPLAAQFGSHGWNVIAVDVQESVVDAINAGRSHVGGEPGLAELVRATHAAGRLRATTDTATASRDADVVVVIVPVMLDDENKPDYRHMDAAVASITPGIHQGSLVIFETTLPVGITRQRYVPVLEAGSSYRVEDDFFVAFSPERLYSGAALRNLATYPKLVGGIGSQSGERASRFYASVLDAEVVLMSSAEAAEFAKLADTTYRDVNIALANEFARQAEHLGVDMEEVIAAANSQPYSHIHQPGLGVGGHCIPVYPHFLLAASDPEMELVALARRINDGQVGLAVREIEEELAGLDDVPVLVLGLTYRHGVNELAYSRAIPLIDRLRASGAVVSAYDPLLSTADIARCGARPYEWGTPAPFRAIVLQTADALWAKLDFDLYPELELIFDGRNGLPGSSVPDGVAYRGVGVPTRRSRGQRPSVAEPRGDEPAPALHADR